MIPDVMAIVNERFDGIHDLNEVNVMDEIEKMASDILCRLFFGKNFSKLQVDGMEISLAL